MNKSFLPLLYLTWKEVPVRPDILENFRNALSERKDWKEEERTAVLNQLLPGAPPSEQTLKEWKKEILQALEKNPDTRTLAEAGVAMEGHAALLPLFEKIGDQLGFSNREAIFHFRGDHHTITSEHGSEQRFRPALLSKILSGKYSILHNAIKQTLSAPEFRYVNPDQRDAYREKVLEWCKILAQKGWGAMAYPEAQGGGNDMEAYFEIMETLSYHDLSLVIKFGVQFGLWGMSVYFLGTEKHHRQYLRDIGTLALPGCFAMTETHHGSNVKGIETTATYDHASSSFTIHTPHPSAQKEYIGNAALHGRMATVFAKLIIDGEDFGVNAFIVTLRDTEGNVLPGITIADCGRKMGLNGVDNGTIRFDKIQIPKENMLDRFSTVTEEGAFSSPIASENRRFFTMLGTLVGGRIGIPRSALAATRSGLTIAIRYAAERRQFGPEGAPEVPILNYRMHQRRLMPLLATNYALHFALRHLTDRFLARTDKDIQEVEALAAGLKAYTTWYATAALQECRECCGGKGYLSENRIDALKNDTDVYTTFEGDNTVLMQLVAKSRLTDFRQEFSDMNLFTVLNYISEQARTSFTEKNPIVVRNTSTEHLLSESFHLNAFRYREKDILASAAKRLKRLIEEGMDSFDAMNVCQHHLLNVGEAYIERIVLETFQSAVATIEDAAVQEAMRKLCRLYALHALEKHASWYLEQGYMEGVKTKSIRKTVNQLCWEIRQDALLLVEAFEVPEACLAAEVLQD